MVERNVRVDHVTIWRWVQRYAPELHRRCRAELRMTNRSWRVDETYLKIAGKWTYLYRAVDSSGDTIDFLLSPKRDADAAKRFFQKALQSPNHPRPRVSVYLMYVEPSALRFALFGMPIHLVAFLCAQVQADCDGNEREQHGCEARHTSSR
jgi:DDE domain